MVVHRFRGRQPSQPIGFYFSPSRGECDALDTSSPDMLACIWTVADHGFFSVSSSASAGVWACLPDAAAGERDRSPETTTGKRRKREGNLGFGAGCSSSHDEGLGFGDEGASSRDGVVCPICLGTIDEAGEAVLQWCMHRFCAHCIEEWSKVRRVCPLCKAGFRGWFHGVHSNNKFQERILPPEPSAAPPPRHPHPRGGDAASRFRAWRDSRRQERGRGSRLLQPQGRGRSAPFPTQRSFGLPRQHQSAEAMRVLEEQAAAKALQWRKSIYNRNLRAHPFEVGKRSMVTKDARTRAERRLEPWISRELQAVAPNSDHGFLARFVLGLWRGAEHGTGSTEAAAVRELQRFLGEKAELFWHELRCFAESPFTMQAYDTVVVYTGQDRASSHQNTRRRSETGSVPGRVSSRPLNNEDLQVLRGGRHHSVAEGSSGQHRKADNSHNRDNQRKKRSHSDGISIAEDRWQLSYC